MRKISSLFLFILMVNIHFLYAQRKLDRQILADLQQYAGALSSFNARSNSQENIAKYIAARMKQLQLQPVTNDKQYVQSFSIDEGKIYEPGSMLSINNHTLVSSQDFFPLPYSAETQFSGEPIISIQELNKPWMLNINDIMANAGSAGKIDTPHLLYMQAVEAQNNGATAVLFYNNSGLKNDLFFDKNDQQPIVKIPVIFIKSQAAKQYLSDATASVKLAGKVIFHEKIINGVNVIGVVNNHAPFTVLITACDTDINSTAGLLTLAELLKDEKRPKYNYAFLVYSSDENILEQNNFWSDHPLISADKINYMLKLHHIGNAISENTPLMISGISSSPQWEDILDKVKDKHLAVQTDMAVYHQQPVLFSAGAVPLLVFSTKIQQDDQADINNEISVIEYLQRLIEETNKRDKLATSE